MDSKTVDTILIMRKGSEEIEVLAESVQVCTRENCNCVGTWGHVFYDDEVNNAVREGFVQVGKKEVTT